MTAGPVRLSHGDMGGLKQTNMADGTNATDAVTFQQLTANAAADRARSNHTGTQTASTISDFDTQVRTSRLDQMAAPTSAVNFNSQRVASVGSATQDSDAPNWGQVKDLISGLRKQDVKAVQTGSTITGLITVDGVTLAANDRVLVTGAGASNGIYLAQSGAWTRATDADVAAEFNTQWLVTVSQGTANADTLWQHATDAAVTLGTTTLTFVKLGPISAATETGVSATNPSTAAGGSWAYSHSLGTRAVFVCLFRTASPYDEVIIRNERTDANTVTFKPDVALNAGEWTAVVRKGVV